MKPVSITGVGVVAPGVESWTQARAHLRAGEGCEASQALARTPSSLLPANERRRTTRLIDLALQCCHEALGLSGEGSAALPATVFACSCGDLDVVDRILVALAQPERPVSPTQFHNSVHNAPAGYLSIATGNRAPSTSLSAHDASFVAGLLEAATQVHASGDDVLLVTYDGETPERLRPFRPRVNAFAVAMRLSARDGFARVAIDLVEDGPVNTVDGPGWEALRSGNPAARSLPLLQGLAQEAGTEIYLPYLDGQRARLVLEAERKG